jgi:hypothetical protein
LWLNAIGAIMVIIFGYAIQLGIKKKAII